MRVSLFLGSVTLPALAVDLDPQRVGGYDTIAYAFSVAVSGNYVYLTDLVIDVSNPASPRGWAVTPRFRDPLWP